MNKIKGTYKVVSNLKLSSRLYKISLYAENIRKEIKPGQFVNIKIQEGIDPFLRRPFSVSRAEKYVEIFYDVVGKGTTILSNTKKGEYLDVLGPLGKGFSLPNKNVKQVVMIAGGIGVAPFLMLSDMLKNKYEIILLYGSRGKDYIFDMKEYKKNGCSIFISTEDGSVGVKGRVSELYSNIKKDSETTMIYTCGPKPMMASVQKFAEKYKIKGEAACEEEMACGIGICKGCAIRTKDGYNMVCHDGPVFDLQDIVFNK